MPGEPRESNTLLGSWLDEAGWGLHETARQVRAEALAAGHERVKPTATNVRRWRHGVPPRHPTPLLLARALSRRFGRVITPVQLGLDRSVPSVLDSLSLAWHARSTVEATEECVEVDWMLSRREAVHDVAGVALGAVLIEPLQGWLSGHPEGVRAQAREGGEWVGPEQV